MKNIVRTSAFLALLLVSSSTIVAAPSRDMDPLPTPIERIVRFVQRVLKPHPKPVAKPDGDELSPPKPCDPGTPGC